MTCSKSRTQIVVLCGLAIGIVGAAITLGIYFGTQSEPTATTTSPAPTPTQPAHRVFSNNGRPGLSGALVDYVYRQDDPPVYDYEVYRTEVQNEFGVTTYLVNLTSQVWMDDKFSNHPLWYHNLVIHVPNTISQPSAGFLHVTSGSNEGREADLGSTEMRRSAMFAGETGILSAVLRQVPNQYVIFEDDGELRNEDDLIAWTWRRYYNDTYTSTQNPDILARWPMVKSVVRAMDAMTELAKEKADINIDKFMLSGASKRGWTVWMAGAVDRRVVAMVPIVLSCLNMVENFRHYWQSFGAWPWVMRDYWNHGIMERMDEDRMGEVIFYVDPYQYRQWMNIPKYMISGASDEFFLIDDYDYFYDSLPGDNSMWIVENSGHNAASSGPHGETVWESMQTFYLSVLRDESRPSFEFERIYNSSGGLMTVKTSKTPTYIAAWAAQSVTPVIGTTYRRDWRMSTLGADGSSVIATGILWNETQLQPVNIDDDTYEIYYENPANGYLAFYVKMKFDAGFEAREYIYSTKAQIIPNNFPFPRCTECRGILV